MNLPLDKNYMITFNTVKNVYNKLALTTASLISASLILTCVASPASAATLFNTAVIHIGVDDQGIFGVSNIINFLQTDNRFSSITNIDVDANGVPTIATLQSFDSVLVTTDNRVGTISNGGLGTQLGNILDDYVFSGGRVVLSAFDGNIDIGIDGDILNLAPYTPIGFNAPAGSLNFETADLTSPFLSGVTSFNSTFASDVRLSAIGNLVASYNSGTLGIATVADNSVIFVNAFPGTQDDFNNGSDFGQVFVNALTLSKPRAVPEPDSVLGVLAVSALSIGSALKRKQKHKA